MPFLNKKLGRFLKVRWNSEPFRSELTTVQKLTDYLWLRKSGSKLSVISYYWHIYWFCRWAKFTPDDILDKSREESEDLVQRYLDEVRKRSMQRGSSVRYVNASLVCLKAFFRVNGFSRENNQELRLQSYHQPPRTRNNPQYVPTIEEACRMAERAGSKRNRAIVYFLFSTGLRNTSLRAILVRDISKEIKDGCAHLLIKIEPEWNKRMSGACKNNIPYYTFTSLQATKAIKEMLAERLEKLQFVGPDEPLFIAERSYLQKRKPLSNKTLETLIKNAAKEAGIEDWKHVSPHSLRKVFECVLRSPLKDGGRMDPKDQEFLMGHILPGTQDPYYDWSKINRLRNEFSKLVFTEEKSPEVENLGIYKEMAKLFGINPDEIRKKKEEELSRLLTLKEEKEELETSIKARLTSNPKEEASEQKIIPKNELQDHLNNGWKFLSIIDQDHAIVEK